MAAPDSTLDLPLLETLDAAPGQMLAADRVSAVGALLLAKGLLQSALVSGATVRDGHDLVWGFHRAARYGGARRVRDALALTSAGERLLRERGIEASDAARREVEELAARPREEVVAEASRCAAAPS
jgi:hypothetical protein